MSQNSQDDSSSQASNEKQVAGSFTRRNFLISSAAGAASLVPRGAFAEVTGIASGSESVLRSVRVSLLVNGVQQTLALDPRTTLLDALREHLHQTGTKKGCDHGQCGACTVLVNGRRINSCLTLALMNQDVPITTIEGLGKPGALHPMQAAFVKHDGFQCGYCTPGQICSAVAVLDEIHADVPSHVTVDLLTPARLSDSELRERMSGNLCRCGAYSNIIEAISEVGGQSA